MCSGLFILFQTIEPLFWYNLKQNFINNSKDNKLEYNQSEDDYFIKGEVIEITDTTIKLKTEDSYFTISVDGSTPIKDFAAVAKVPVISNIKIGADLIVRIEGSKYLSKEPFSVRYILFTSEVK